MSEKQPVMEYPPKYVVVNVLPQMTVTTFETAKEVIGFLWGNWLPHFAVFKRGELVCLEGGEFDEVVERLEKAGDNK